MSDAASPQQPDGTPPPAPSGQSSGSPSGFLKAVVGKRVVVRLVSGVDYKGTLDFLAREPEIRCSSMLGWIYEHRDGADGGTRQWSGDESIWRRIHTWKQCALHFGWGSYMKVFNQSTTLELKFN